MKKTLLLAVTIFCFLNLTNAQPGQLDPSFGTNGIVRTDLGKSYSHNASPADQIIPQADGSMYIRQASLISKRNSNGSIDEVFGPNGYTAGAGFDINRAAVQSDGKIVVAGAVKIDNDNPTIYQSNYALARYNADGTLDHSFSGDGKLTTDLDTIKRSENEDGYESNDEAFSVAVQKDGKIIAAGHSNNYLSMCRYNIDGSLDSTFSSDGLVISNIYNYTSEASVVIQNDGKIVIAGGSLIIRYNADGSQDNTFSGNGTRAFQTIQSMVIQKEGKIVVSGYTSNGSGTYANILARLNTDGSLDNSFSGDGIRPTDFEVNSLALQSDGKIVTGGNVTTNDSTGTDKSYFATARYNTNGSLDQSFSGDGKQTTSFGSVSNEPKTVAIQFDGKIVAGGGYSSYAGGTYSSYFALIRYNTNGSLDNTFDGDGKLTETDSAGKTVYNKTAVQKDGKIVAAGSTWDGSKFVFAIVRYNTDGSLDNTFSEDGKQTTSFNGDAVATSLAIQSDGKIIAAGGSHLARINTDGSLDKTFGVNGKQVNDSIYITSIATQIDGKIVVAGGQSFINEDGGITYPAVARYNMDGSLDKTFGVNGKQTIALSDGAFRSIAVQHDGKIVGASIVRDGPYDGYVILDRLNTNGSIDSTFVSGGFGGANSCAVIVQSDGKIVVAGSGDDHDTWNTFIKRLNIDGSIDSSFHANGGGGYYKSTRNTSIALQDDGKILVSSINFSRFNTDGSDDTTFNTNAAEKAGFKILDIAIANNKLYAVGGGIYGYVARYLLDSNNTAPTVSLTAPADNITRLAPAAHIKLSAAAADKDGTITKVEFYNGATLLHTETVIPYGYVWRNVPLGNYTITAKAYDNSGNITTSAPVHISVVPNKPPVVSIIKPFNNQSFAAPGYIHLEAAANDTDGRITNVKFYNGATLLRTEFKYPYTYVWKNVPAGAYTITAVATDNWGAHTTSAPVIVNVTNAMIVSSKPFAENDKMPLNDALSLKVYPNPAARVINITASGLQQDKQTTISVISAGGIVMKTVQMKRLNQLQLDVSTLASGVYTIKLVSGDKVSYAKFVKL